MIRFITGARVGMGRLPQSSAHLQSRHLSKILVEICKEIGSALTT